MVPARILVSTFGSAGDLFPLVPMAARLQEMGHDVRWAVPRGLGLYLRAWQQPMYALGSGAEMRVLEDPRIVTNRFGGWASWRLTMTDYVQPTLRDDVGRLGKIFAEWRPDVAVTMSFSVAARLAAHLHGLPRVDLSIYPQQVARLPAARSFGRGVQAAVTELCAEAGAHSNLGDELMSALLWGIGPGGQLLHDRALLGAPGTKTPEPVGFPYWDGANSHPGQADVVLRWIDESDDPVVLVTLGSFLGAQQQKVWLEAADAGEALGLRMVFVGPQRPGNDRGFESRPGLLRVGFVPLSLLADRVDLFVHHGGVGTMFGALRAGVPAIVVPLAFDQSFNATLLEAAGAGVDASRCPLHEAIERALRDPRLGSTARALAGEMVPDEVATNRVVDRVLHQIESTR